MLYQVGPLTVDTFPFETSDVTRKTSADFAKHDLLSTRRDYEFSGPGEGTLKISGKLLPFHIGGLSELEFASQLCEAGGPLFVMRGDGRVLGWHQLMSVEEAHSSIGPTGVGFEIKYDLSLERCRDPGTDVGAAAIDTILSLFG